VVRPGICHSSTSTRSVPSKLNVQHEPTAKACAEDNEGRSHPAKWLQLTPSQSLQVIKNALEFANTFPGELKRRRTQETLPYLGRSESKQYARKSAGFCF
jgi:hypothetical protein